MLPSHHIPPIGYYFHWQKRGKRYHGIKDDYAHSTHGRRASSCAICCCHSGSSRNALRRCSVAADHQINHRCRCLPKEPWMPPTEAPTHAATRQNYHRCRHCRSYHRCLCLPKLVLKLSPAKVTINAAARRHSQTRQKCGDNDTTTKSKQPIPSLLAPMPPVPRCHQYLH